MEKLDAIKMPEVNFEPLLNNSEDALLEKLRSNSSACCFLVYLRYKYSFETEWTYSIECCGLYGSGYIEWFNDWYEGQQDIEYLGVAVIDYPVGE